MIEFRCFLIWNNSQICPLYSCSKEPIQHNIWNICFSHKLNGSWNSSNWIHCYRMWLNIDFCAWFLANWNRRSVSQSKIFCSQHSHMVPIFFHRFLCDIFVCFFASWKMDILLNNGYVTHFWISMHSLLLVYMTRYTNNIY